LSKFPSRTIVSALEEPDMSNDKETKISTNKETPLRARKLSFSDKAAQAIGDAVRTPKIPLNERLKKLTNEQNTQLQEIEDIAIANFVGNFDELESALGMLRIGHHVGWRVLYIVHSKKTIRNYEAILDIKIRELFDERGPSAGRSTGLALAEKFSNFWKVVSGAKDHKIDADKRKIIE